MKAIIFCDDFSFAAKVRSTLFRVGRRSDVGIRWKSKAWPLRALNHSAMAEKLLDDAAEAHLVVISNEHAHSLPDGLRSWLEKWAVLPGIKPRAVGVFQDDNDRRSTSDAYTELRLLLEKHDLDLITDERRIQSAEGGLVARFAEESTQPVVIARQRLSNATRTPKRPGHGTPESVAEFALAQLGV